MTDERHYVIWDRERIGWLEDPDFSLVRPVTTLRQNACEYAESSTTVVSCRGNPDRFQIYKAIPMPPAIRV